MLSSSVFRPLAFSVEGQLSLGSLGTLQLGSLIGLFAIPCVAVLVLAYWRKKPNLPMVVSSVLLLKLLPRKPIPKTRLKLPPRFYFEALFLGLLGFVLGTPAFDRHERLVAIVVDNSLSMQAAILPGQLEKTRIQEAKRRVNDFLTQHPRRAKFSLFVTSPRLAALVADPASGEEISSALAQANVTSADDSLSAAVTELRLKNTYDEIVVFSDKTLRAENQRFLGTPRDPQIDSVRVGAPVPNLAIVGVKIEAGESNQGSTLQTRILGAALVPTEAEVDLFAVGATGVRDKGFSGITKKVAIPSSGTADVRFEIPANWASSPAFEVQLRAVNTTDDNLVTDNSAWATAQPSRQNTILLVTQNASDPQALGLNRVGLFQVEQTTLERYAALSVEMLKKFSVVVFHRCLPDVLQKHPTLAILPALENPLFPVIGQISGPQITSWMEDHPLTTYLRVPLLEPSSGEVFRPLPWAQSVLNTNTGSLLLAGESEGSRFVVSGLELLPYEGKNTPVVSILTLNIFSWLTGGSPLTDNLLVGKVFELTEGQTWIVGKPSGGIETFNVASGAPQQFLFELPGIYQMNVISGSDSAEIRRQQKLFAVNSFSATESNTMVVQEYELPSKRLLSTETERPLFPLWPILLAIIVVMLLLDMGYRAVLLLKAAPGSTRTDEPAAPASAPQEARR